VVTSPESEAASQVSSSLPMSETITAIGEMQGPHSHQWPPGGGERMHLALASSMKIQRGRQAEGKATRRR
jgi:hypothetical protein